MSAPTFNARSFLTRSLSPTGVALRCGTGGPERCRQDLRAIWPGRKHAPATLRVRAFACSCALVLAGAILITGVEARAISLPPVWRWSNPRPHGANIVDQATVGPLSVQVGERGQIFTSDDWRTWWPRDSHTTVALRAATFFGGRLVITGEAGTVLFADRPDQFYLLDLGTTNWLEGVAASPALVVAVGDSAAIYVSTNAVVWQRLTGVPFTKGLRAVTYGEKGFVAVGESGLIATSANGLTWQTRNSTTTTNLNRVAWLGDHFLAAGDGGILLSSTNGVQWTKINGGATNALYGLAGESGSRVADGYHEVRLSEQGAPWSNQLAATLAAPAPAWSYYSALYSSNCYLLSGRTGLNVEGLRANGGVRWQATDPSVRTWLWAVARTPSHYVAVGDYGTILSSPDGLDWDLELVPTAATNSVLLGVGGSSNLLLAVGSRGTILRGTNVFLWHAIPPPTSNDLQGVCFDGQQFVLSGGNGTILTSPDGSQWTQRATPTSQFLMSVAAFPSGLVAVGEDGVILTSTNGGTNWVQRASGTTNWLSQVRWLHDRLLAVGENGTLLASFDGRQWWTNRSVTDRWLNAAEFVDGVWLVAGNQGTFLASPDSTNWYSFGTVTKKSLYGAVAHAGLLVTVGAEGVILRTRLVPDLTPVHIARFSRVSGVNLFLFTGAPDQRFALQSSPDLSRWTDDVLLELLDSTGTLLWLAETGTNAPGQMFYRTRLLP